jgi:hypothetical protein
VRYDSAPERLRPRRIPGIVSAWFFGAIAPLNARLRPMRRETFRAWGRELPYLVHPYNSTWRNERSVEVPLARAFLEDHGHGRGMEFGNVLSHYGLSTGGEVVDKYEKAPGVANVDILDHHPAVPLDFIVCISTLEHVGWDESPRDEQKAIRALTHLRSLLADDGRMFLTVPLGHHPVLDEALAQGIGTVREMTMVRRKNGRWFESPGFVALPYVGRRGIGAASIWIGEVAGGRQ